MMALTVRPGGDFEGRRGLGWLPDFPDIRDYKSKTGPIESLLSDKTSVLEFLEKEGEPPTSVDLRAWCSPVEDQGGLGSCTAQAGAGMLEYFERRAYGKHLDASRLFLYKVTRSLGGLVGDSGAHLRTTMGAMTLFGVPPEEFWPYTDSEAEFDVEPPAFCYSFAQNYQALNYYRLDPPDATADFLLTSIKAHLASQLPAIFGFAVYGSIVEAAETGRIPFPVAGDRVEGGHAVMAVGYDDSARIPNREGESRGGILIRNSWGPRWGEEGYGWLPYEYVLEGLATDWWVMLESEWVDTEAFKAQE
jgi:C1A family cysteine protease